MKTERHRVTLDIRTIFNRFDLPSWRYNKDGIDMKVVFIVDDKGEETFHSQGISPREKWTPEFSNWLDGITREHPRAKVKAWADVVHVREED